MSDEEVGLHTIQPRAAVRMTKAVVACDDRTCAEDSGRSCHAHPTYTDVFKKAVLACKDSRAIHA